MVILEMETVQKLTGPVRQEEEFQEFQMRMLPLIMLAH
jgi:hypothetical protein